MEPECPQQQRLPCKVPLGHRDPQDAARGRTSRGQLKLQAEVRPAARAEIQIDAVEALKGNRGPVAKVGANSLTLELGDDGLIWVGTEEVVGQVTSP